MKELSNIGFVGAVACRAFDFGEQGFDQTFVGVLHRLGSRGGESRFDGTATGGIVVVAFGEFDGFARAHALERQIAVEPLFDFL